MVRYRQMEIFLAVIKAGSLAAAGRTLELSPATVERSVAALETQVGASLLRRGPRGITLSPSGELFAERCQHILLDIAEAERSAAGLHRRPAGQLTVAMPLPMVHRVFTALAVDYLHQFPDVHMRTRSCEGLPKLLEEGIDIALVVGQLPDSSNFATLVGTIRPIICASPAYLARWGQPHTARDLRAHRAVVATSASLGADWWSNREGDVPNVFKCTTQQGAIQAAVSGLGLIRCMNYEAYPELQSGQLQTVLDREPAPDLPVQIVYREGRRACARVRTFIDFAVPRLRAHPALQCGPTSGLPS